MTERPVTATQYKLLERQLAEQAEQTAQAERSLEECGKANRNRRVISPETFVFMEPHKLCGYWGGVHVVSGGRCRCGLTFELVETGVKA